MAVRYEIYFRDEILVLRVFMIPNVDKRGLEVASKLWYALGHNN